MNVEYMIVNPSDTELSLGHSRAKLRRLTCETNPPVKNNSQMCSNLDHPMRRSNASTNDVTVKGKQEANMLLHASLPDLEETRNPATENLLGCGFSSENVSLEYVLDGDKQTTGSPGDAGALLVQEYRTHTSSAREDEHPIYSFPGSDSSSFYSQEDSGVIRMTGGVAANNISGDQNNSDTRKIVIPGHYTAEKLRHRDIEWLNIIKQRNIRMIYGVSEELVQLLKERHELRDQVDMRKVTIEQLLNFQVESQYC